MNTWNYLTFDETSEISDEWVWERLRHRRNNLLGACDLKMIIDAPWDVAPWKAYRQALRDLPAQTKDPRQAIWPVSPDGFTVPAYTEPYVYVEPVIEPVLEQVFSEEELDEADTPPLN
jgi:hypothetical protein